MTSKKPKHSYSDGVYGAIIVAKILDVLVCVTESVIILLLENVVNVSSCSSTYNAVFGL